MHYTKPMIDLVLLIRKTAPSHIKPQIKLANPELLDKLVGIYPTIEERMLRALVFELMTMAGPKWVRELKQRTVATHSSDLKASKVPTEQNNLPQNAAPATAKPRTRIYRGQVVPASS